MFLLFLSSFDSLRILVAKSGNAYWLVYLFQGIVPAFDQSARDWEEWFRANEPEVSDLPGEWEGKCNELQRMVLIRCLRQAYFSC